VIALRPYQSDLERRTGEALRRVKRVLLQCPPGGGKTAIATSISQKFASRGAQAWFICHRAELVEQTSKTFHKHGLPHGYIAAGYPLSLGQLVQVCSIDTLKGRLDKLKAPRIALVDEAHHGGAAGWALVIKWLVDNGCQVIGLSGTPRRHDGTGLDAHFDELVLGPAVDWLMAEGYLSQYAIYAPSAPDMVGVRKLMGEYNKADAEERMRKPKLTGSMTTHWLKYGKGLRTIGFAVSVAHSTYLRDEFRGAGVKAEHLDGKTPKAERKRIIAGFADGDIEVIFNVALFGEGFDLSAIAGRDVTIDCVIDAAPGLSLPWYLQKVMRCMRPAPGKVGIILDHAGNCHRHGFPDDDREWTLEGSGKGKKAGAADGPPPPLTCGGCFIQIRRPLPECCPGCGKRLTAEVKPLEVAEGVLGLVTAAEKKAIRARRQQEEDDCADLGAMVALGQRRGHMQPITWAQKRLAGRRKSNT
jgi:superfamily II DNA or RNA helicase